MSCAYVVANKMGRRKVCGTGWCGLGIRMLMLINMMKKMILLSVFIPLTLLIMLPGCQRSSIPVIVQADGNRQQIVLPGGTVRDALAAAGVTLGALDRVQPDLYVEVAPGMVIHVTRVEERYETERVTVPYAHKVVVNEALPTGETRLIQLGMNGEDEITYRVVLEDGKVVERIRVSQVPIKLPQDEIVAVGATHSLRAVPLEGTIAYLSAGNAWVMRGNSAARRPLTTEGDLDGRVFELSPDGRWLLYTRRLEGDIETPLNQLWMVKTTVVGEPPISLPVRGVLYAQWSPDGKQIAYSTAERTTSPPGWRANNDLWIAKADARAIARATPVITANVGGVYGWWGSKFAWSPEGSAFAYARADQVGIYDVLSGTTTVLRDFAPYNTYSEWVWTPELSWSPDGRFLAAVVHGEPLANEDVQDSPVFDLWLFAPDGSLQVRVAERVGMWSAPNWGHSGLLHGQAVDALHSMDSRYTLILRDHDGSNPRQLFPQGEGTGVLPPPEVAWSPSGETFVFVYNGNLYLGNIRGGIPQQLTSTGQISRPRWAADEHAGESVERPSSSPDNALR